MSKDLGFIQSVLDRGIRLPFDGDPHDYQIADLNDRMYRDRCGYFWGIGLGKTVAGALTAGYHLMHGFDRAYVICPASITDQWRDTLVKMNFDTLLYAGSPKKRERFDFDHDFIVMSFEIFQKDYDRIKQYPGFFIVDEATILANPSNLFYKMLNGGIVEKRRMVPGMLKPMVDKIQYPNINKGCCLLTATPSNNPADLYGLIKTIDPGIYSSQFEFNRLHVSEEDYFGAPVSFVNLDLLRDNLRSVASIRFVSDHLDLPEKIFNIVEYDLDPEHYALYKRLSEERLLLYKDEIVVNALQATSLYNFSQKIILSPDIAMYKKEPKGLALLDTIVRNNPQTLIVNKFVMTNQKMMTRYSDIGIGGCFGGVPRPQQVKYIQAFKDRRLRALAVNPKSGGIGLNLQICSNVVLPEIPVTARDMDQSIGRCWRQGQKERVVITLLIARRTIQKTLLKRVMERDDVNSLVLGSPKTLRQELFPED